MPVSLAKGQRISLEKVAPGLSEISVEQVANAFVCIVKTSNQQEVVRYDLTEDYSIEHDINHGGTLP